MGWQTSNPTTEFHFNPRKRRTETGTPSKHQTKNLPQNQSAPSRTEERLVSRDRPCGWGAGVRRGHGHYRCEIGSARGCHHGLSLRISLRYAQGCVRSVLAVRCHDLLRAFITRHARRVGKRSPRSEEVEIQQARVRGRRGLCEAPFPRRGILQTRSVPHGVVRSEPVERLPSHGVPLT